ncbi:MAG: hypothetical protein ABIP85_04345 [Chthoniobacteraceae bacterium]
MKRLTNFTPEYRLRVGDWRVLSEIDADKITITVSCIAVKPTEDKTMTAQIIEKAGKKEFAVIPYREFVKMQEALEDYHALKELQKAKADPKNQCGRPFAEVAGELGSLKKGAPRR